MTPSIRNAFVLGAGLGTRLKSLTAKLPKPLIPICNKPLITFAFDQLIQCGVTKLVINTHHCPEAYRQVFPESEYAGVPLHFIHEPTLLETAGGIKNAEPLLGEEPFVVYNGDILSDLPVEKAIRHHLESGNEVTLVLRSGEGPHSMSLDPQTGRIVDIWGRLESHVPAEFLFTGIYVVSPQFLNRIPALTKISVLPLFLELIQQGQKLGGIVINDGNWWDLGTREQYLAAQQYLSGENGESRIHPSAKIAASAQVSTSTAIGAGAIVGENVTLENCILWENAEIKSGATLKNCIVTAGQSVEGMHEEMDF